MNSVLIRPLEFNDANISWIWRNNPIVWELTGSKPNSHISLENEQEWITKAISDNSCKRFAIIVDDEYVGNIQLTNIVSKDSAEYHIFIGNTDYWGKNIAQVATGQIIRYAKNILKLKTIYLYVKPEHHIAIKVYKKCNFIPITNEVKMILDLNDTIKPMVSVFMLTYNHERYIRQALDGILMQKCLFDFEIVIGEDCSTDNTRKIILEYQNKYPGKFKLLLHDKNIGAMNNQIATFKSCFGKYIALCEGDDYWTDENKLQKQVDFLETNTGHSICWTKFEIKNEAISQNEGEYQKWLELLDGKIPVEVDLNNIFNPYWTLTLTTMFRRSCIENIIFEKFKYFKDNTLYSICLSMGKGCVLDSCTAVYRMHSEGIYSSSSLFKQKYSSYLNIKEIMEIIPGCRNNNFKDLRSFLLRESIKLAQKNSKEYLQLIIDGVRYLEFKNKFNFLLNK